MSAVRVLVAHALPLFGAAIGTVVRESSRLRLVACVADGHSALASLRELEPEVAVIDAALPGVEARRIVALAAQERLPTRIVLIGDGGCADGPYELLAEGAAGCLTPSVSKPELLEAIATVAGGESFLGGQTHTAIAAAIRLRARDDRPRLTDRELEILRRVAAGDTSPQISREMHLSVSTVKTHLSHAFEKLDARDRAAAVATALRRGLLD